MADISDLTAKTVLITGAGGNLGAAAVHKFLKEGFRVVALVSPGKTLPYPVDGDVTVIGVDLTHEAETHQVIEKIKGNLDAVLLLAGGYQYGEFVDVTSDQVKKMIALNFDTAFHVAMPALKKMMQQQAGRLVLVGAQPALNGEAGKHSAAYALSKSLVFQLAELLNATGAAQQVSASVLVPSILDTPQNRVAMPQADFSKWTPLADAADTLFYMATAPSVRSAVVKM